MHKAKILIVEDHPGTSALIRTILEREGFQLRQEYTSGGALAAALEFCPDIVLMDVFMPGKDGGEVAKQIALEPTLAKTRVLFVTSLIEAQKSGSGPQVYGGQTFIPKPVSKRMLLDSVRTALGSH
jgi:CheY-like chemotaxis protein